MEMSSSPARMRRSTPVSVLNLSPWAESGWRWRNQVWLQKRTGLMPGCHSTSAPASRSSSCGRNIWKEGDSSVRIGSTHIGKLRLSAALRNLSTGLEALVGTICEVEWLKAGFGAGSSALPPPPPPMLLPPPAETA